METTWQNTEPLVYRGSIKMPYRWAVGETGSRFFVELRDHGRIWGTKCPSCGIVFVPPRRTCPRCLGLHMEWQELARTGTLLTYTVVRYQEPALHSFPAPFAYGLVRLDGADTGLLHLLGEVDLEDIASGLRVEAVLKEKAQRQGNILDIKYFRPV